MPDAPAAEIPADRSLVRRLLAHQASAIPGAARLPLRLVDEGWDNRIWRLGTAWTVRLPRRAIAAPLIEGEQRWLPTLGPRIAAASGLAVPVPVVAGRPSADFPWPWSVAAWTAGASGLAVPRTGRRTWAVPLARALGALHRIAPADHPVNPFRGVPLAMRDAGVRENLDRLAGGRLDPALVRAAGEAWTAALAQPEWSGAPVWIHGDLHPGNVIARDEGLAAIIDFGDLTAGDPAYDLAAAWLAFDRGGRADFVSATGITDDALWARARGWAAAVASMLAVRSDDRADYAALAEGTLRQLG
ncbi:aminoglycoside phosphotransferase family protein [Microbacter sp. GSS18]|nr:aminoglycoside phosphotransferase family protein [Microbacter sp. GSS18]